MSTTGPVDSQPHVHVSPVGAFAPAGFASPGGTAPSAESPRDREAFDEPSAFPGPQAGHDSSSADKLLIQQTKNEIRSLVQEVTHLAHADIPLDEFYPEFLGRVVQALASSGGAIWTVDASGNAQLEYQINLPRAALQAANDQRRHALLLKNVAASGQPTLVPPQSGSADESEAGNPTHQLLILTTFRREAESLGIIEIFQRPGGGPTTQRGYLRFLVQMTDVIAGFLQNQRLRRLDDRQSLWNQFEDFVRRVHGGLDSRAAAFAIANDGRSLIRCDRLSVTLRRGGRQSVVAVSGIDAIDPRADDIKRMERLATAVAAVGQPLWYTGSIEDLPPQLALPLTDLVDHAHATLVAVVPLYRPSADGEQAEMPGAAPLGALIIEQFSDARMESHQRERVDLVARHSAAALANACDHESVFLMPLWRSLGRMRWIAEARNLPMSLGVAAAIVALALVLLLLPFDFDLAARGKLQPVVRRDVFAGIDGLIVDVPVHHQQTVAPGDVLARLKNNRLEVEIADLIGRRRANQERMRALERAQLESRRLSIEQQNQLAGELLELAEVEQSINRQLELLREKGQQLTIRSEMHGQVVTWSVDDLLLRRPVQMGQALMTVVDPSGDWELELYVPERRMGHVARAALQSNDPLRVTFVLASHPDLEFEGQVVEIHGTAEVHGDEGNAVLIRAAIDKHDLPELRSETTVTTKIHCGRRPIGYVLFHELFETVQSRVLFWL